MVIIVAQLAVRVVCLASPPLTAIPLLFLDLDLSLAPHLTFSLADSQLELDVVRTWVAGVELGISHRCFLFCIDNCHKLSSLIILGGHNSTYLLPFHWVVAVHVLKCHSVADG